MADTFASALHSTAMTYSPIVRESAPRSLVSLAGLRAMLETWEERKRVRMQLEYMLTTAPHLIDDIGLTMKQVEADIAKPFWRA